MYGIKDEHEKIQAWVLKTKRQSTGSETERKQAGIGDRKG